MYDLSEISHQLKIELHQASSSKADYKYPLDGKKISTDNSVDIS